MELTTWSWSTRLSSYTRRLTILPPYSYQRPVVILSNTRSARMPSRGFALLGSGLLQKLGKGTWRSRDHKIWQVMRMKSTRSGGFSMLIDHPRDSGKTREIACQHMLEDMFIHQCHELTSTCAQDLCSSSGSEMCSMAQEAKPL